MLPIRKFSERLSRLRQTDILASQEDIYPMANENEMTFGPVDRITTDAVGKPGERTFFIQATQQDQVITLLIEKYQIQTLAIGVEQFLSELATQYPQLEAATADYNEDKMRIHPPVDPLFRVGDLGISYDSENDYLILVVREVPTEEEGTARTMNILCTRSQMLALCRWGLELSGRGRSICPQCGEPMDPGGHFCPKKNGHKP
jgi:uncharacterized repeat protein (TIGR03847 family)